VLSAASCQLVGPQPSARRTQRRRRARRVKVPPARAERLAHGALGRDARVAWRAGGQVIVDAAAIRVGQLAVDVRGDERIDRAAIRH
jgi:hypothetical protein